MKGSTMGKLAALGVVVAFGVVRMPLERGLEQELRGLHFRDARLDLSMREQLGQGMFVAAIGGFRSLIASILYLQAFADFENREWGKVEGHYAVITGLQPRSAFYWDHAHWYTAYNAVGYYQRTAAAIDERKAWEAWKMTHELVPYYLERGRKFLEDGLRHNPNDYRLHRSMGALLRNKYDDNCAAADWYLRGSRLPGAPSILYRMYLYMVAQCPERIDEAYAALRDAYAAGVHTPTVVTQYEAKEDHFIDAAIATQSPEQLAERARAADDAEYLPLARLARYWATVGEDPGKAAELYNRIVQIDGAPEFYRKKLAFALGDIPGREREAFRLLGSYLSGKFRGAYDDADAEYARLAKLLGKTPNKESGSPKDSPKNSPK